MSNIKFKFKKSEEVLDTLSDKINQENILYDNKTKKINDKIKLVKTKKAITDLQNETIKLDMNINILNHSLLKYTLETDMTKILNSSFDLGQSTDQAMFEDIM